MTDYSYLFGSEKVYSENLLSFYNLFNSNNVINLVSDNILENDFFLYLVYPSETIVRQLLLYDDLIRFNLIDLFLNNISLIEQREKKINDFLLNNDIDYLDTILKKINTEIDINKMNSLKPIINDIKTNKDLYLHYILSNSISYPNTYEKINLENLSIRLIIMFYFNHFFIQNRSYNLKIEDPDYTEFSRLLIKYSSLYNINIDYTDIIFRKDERSDILLPPNEYLLLYFINSLTNPTLITRNVISWFYIFFSSYIPDNLHNELLYIIFNMSVKKNTIGLITYILKSFNKEYNKFTEDEKNDVLKQIQNDYIYKEREVIANKINIEDYISNLILLNNLSNNDEKFEILKNNTEMINKNNLFFILNTDPLVETWSSIGNKIEKIDMKFQNINYSIVELITIYNSITCTDFSKNCHNNININNKYVCERLEDIIDNGLVDKELLFYNFLLFLNNYEILIFDKETSLTKIVRQYNTDINTIRNIFHSISPNKDFYNGYKEFK